MNPFFVLFFIFSFSASFSQVRLLNPITPNHRPNDTDAIKPFPYISKEERKNPGIYLGDTIPQFKLFGIHGDSLDMKAELAKGKPVFLIAGSYTCEYYRDQVGFFDTLSAAFPEISIYVIYVPEAHPAVPDPCPYTAKSWVIYTKAGHLIDQAQPRKFGERKEVVKRMEKEGLAPFPIFIDDIYNSWWLNFGPAPNISYLIKPNGVIYARYITIKKERVRVFKDLTDLQKKMTE